MSAEKSNTEFTTFSVLCSAGYDHYHQSTVKSDKDSDIVKIYEPLKESLYFGKKKTTLKSYSIY